MRISLSLIALALAGCVGPMKNTFEDRAADYQKAYVLAPIELPGEYDLAAPQEAFPIPGVDAPVKGAGNTGFVIPEAPVVDPSLQTSAIQRVESDTTAYLRVDALPEEIWPELTAFFETNGVGIVPNRNQARIQSGWLSGVASGRSDSDLIRYLPGAADGWRRVIVDVAPGLAVDSTEIRAQMVVATTSTRPAPSATGDAFDSATMALWLDEFGVWLADAKQSGRRVSAVGLGRGAQPRVERLERDDGSLAIAVRIASERTWDSLLSALSNSGFVLEFEDQGGARIQGRYLSDSDRRRLDELNLLTRAFVSVTEDLEALYQVNLSFEGERALIDVQDLGQGGTLSGAEELLLKIAEQLI